MFDIPEALQQAYSHRDCELKPPLWHSLRHGFNFIEADIYCLLGQGFVAHDLQQLRPWKTLERLYLEPLKDLLTKNQGYIFKDASALWLFLDVKTPAQSSYLSLHKLLKRYQAMLTSYSSGNKTQGAISIIISGNRPNYQQFQNLSPRYAALDGRLEDIGVHTDPTVMPVISDNWQKHFSWMGHGEMPSTEQKKLEVLIDSCHRHGQKLRFWASPDQAGKARDRLWEKLLTLGIDLLNTDDVAGLASYLKTKR